MERKKQIKLDAVIKVQNFLQDCKKQIDKGQLFSADKLARSYNTSGSVATHAVRLGILKKGEIKGEYYLGESFDTDRTTAKRIIESMRIQQVTRKQSNIVATLENSTTIGESSRTINQNNKLDTDTVPEIKRDTGQEIASAIKKAFASIQPGGQSLFTGQEKEDDQKFQILLQVVGSFDWIGSSSKLTNTFATEAVEISQTIYSEFKKTL